MTNPRATNPVRSDTGTRHGAPRGHAHEPAQAREAMIQYAEGVDGAFDRLYAITSPALRRYLRGRVPPDRVEDLMQDTYLRLHVHRNAFRREADVLPWLFAIANNLAKDTHRRLGRPGLDCAPESPVPTPAEVLAAKRFADGIIAALEALPERQREAFLRVRLAGRSHQASARALGTTATAVKALVHRATRCLKRSSLPGPA